MDELPEPSVGGELAVPHKSALPDNGFGNGESQVSGVLTLTLISSSHRFLGGITRVVFSSVM